MSVWGDIRRLTLRSQVCSHFIDIHPSSHTALAVSLEPTSPCVDQVGILPFAHPGAVVRSKQIAQAGIRLYFHAYVCHCD